MALFTSSAEAEAYSWNVDVFSEGITNGVSASLALIEALGPPTAGTANGSWLRVSDKADESFWRSGELGAKCSWALCQR